MSIISSDIDMAVKLLEGEDVVAIPTETVYGLAGNIFSEKAIKKIFAVKQRPLFNPLIVHLHSPEQIENIVLEFPPKAKLLAEKFWPGSLTLVLKKQAVVPDLITAGKDTVAIRIPNHPVTRELLKRLSFPLAAPSANPFNRISPTSAAHVEAYFGNQLAMILDGGECAKGLESTIIGFEEGEPVLYRLGSITLEEIEEQVGEIRIQNKKEDSPDAPGMLAKHYSPTTRTILVEDIIEALGHETGKKIAVLSFKDKIESSSISFQQILSESGDLEEAASNLYSALHDLDQLNVDLIIVERMPDQGLGRTMNDRLQRAAH
jgi:L-threonylcarbamoyladenylate synthase